MDEREEHENVLRRIRAESGAAYEATRRTQSGEKLAVEISYVPIRDEAGALVGQLSSSRDITARKRAQEMQALATSTARWLKTLSQKTGLPPDHRPGRAPLPRASVNRVARVS